MADAAGVPSLTIPASPSHNRGLPSKKTDKHFPWPCPSLPVSSATSLTCTIIPLLGHAAHMRYMEPAKNHVKQLSSHPAHDPWYPSSAAACDLTPSISMAHQVRCFHASCPGVLALLAQNASQAMPGFQATACSSKSSVGLR